MTTQERGGTVALPGSLRPKSSARRHLGSFLRRKPLGAFGAVIALILIFVAVFAPFIATDDPYAYNVENKFASPGEGGILGGDKLGRDVFSRLVYGSRISLYVGLVSAFAGGSIGMIIGVASVYFGGKTDLIVQRFIDGMMSIPPLILAIAIVAALGGSLENVIIALTIAFIPSAARVLRSQALVVKEMDYVLAARAVGAGHWRIILRHMVPNCIALYIIMVTLYLGAAIIAEASLSFLGIGAPPNVPTWGGMLSGAALNYVRVAPWLGVFPGLAIFLVVFAWNLLGDSLRDVLDPRLRGAGTG